MSGREVANWLYLDAGMTTERVRKLAVLSALRPDLEPVCTLLAESEYQHRATLNMLAAHLPRLTSAPAAPLPPVGWWGRVRLAWKMLFPGR